VEAVVGVIVGHVILEGVAGRRPEFEAGAGVIVGRVILQGVVSRRRYEGKAKAEVCGVTVLDGYFRLIDKKDAGEYA